MFVLFVRGPAGSRLPINVLRAAIAGCVHAMRACSGLREFLSDMSIANFPTLNLTVLIVDWHRPAWPLADS